MARLKDRLVEIVEKKNLWKKCSEILGNFRGDIFLLITKTEWLQADTNWHILIKQFIFKYKFIKFYIMN